MLEPGAAARRPRSRVWLVLRVLFPVAALAYLLSIVPLRQLATSLKSVSPLAVLAALLAGAAAQWVGAVRWQLLFSACGIGSRPPLRQLFRLNLIGLFYNSYLPGGVGGDIVRAVATRGLLAERGLPGAMALVLLDRTLGLSGLLMLVACGFSFFPLNTIPHVMLWSTLGLSIAAAAVLAITNGSRIAPYLPKPFRRLFGSLPSIESPSRFVLALLLSVVTQTCGVIVAGHVLIASIDGHVTLKDSMVVLPLIGASQYFPLTVGGAGVREAAFVLLYGLVGVSKSDALAASLLYAGTQYLLAAGGGVLHVLWPLAVESPADLPSAS